VALLALGTIVALLLGEVALRVFDPFQERLRGDQLTLPHDVRYVIENRTNPRLANHIVHTKNGLGFRGPDLPRDRARLLTAFAVGGSTTECFYLGDGQDWPNLLGRELRCSFPRFWINNAGLDGHSSFGHRHLLEQRLLRLKPALVLFLVGANDVARNDLAAAGERRRRAPTLLERVARHSALVASALNAWRSSQARQRGLGHAAVDLGGRAQVPTDEPRLRAMVKLHERDFLPAYRERLLELVRLCRENGTLPVLMTQPLLFGPGRDDVTGLDLEHLAVLDDVEWGWGARRRWNGLMAWTILELYNAELRRLAREQGVPLIDLAQELPRSTRLFYDAMHFTREGAEELARLVAARLCPALADRFPAQRERPCDCLAQGASG